MRVDPSAPMTLLKTWLAACHAMPGPPLGPAYWSMTAAVRIQRPFSDDPRFGERLLNVIPQIYHWLMIFGRFLESVLRRPRVISFSAHRGRWDRAAATVVTFDGGMGARFRRSLPMGIVSSRTESGNFCHGQGDTMLTGSQRLVNLISRRSTCSAFCSFLLTNH
jgi:hypothetical protein